MGCLAEFFKPLPLTSYQSDVSEALWASPEAVDEEHISPRSCEDSTFERNRSSGMLRAGAEALSLPKYVNVGI